MKIKRKLKKKHILIAAGTILVLLVVSGMALRGRGEKNLEVQAAKVTHQKIVQKVSATGTIQPKTQVEISADVSAKITKLGVVEGQLVSKGQFLLELDRERYLAAVQSAEANVRSGQANAALVREHMNRAQKELARAKGLLAGGLESQASFEAKHAEYEVEAARYRSALDQVEQAKATLKQARDDLSKTTIYAPMPGTISALNKERGEIALGSQFQKDVILVVADLSVMEARVNVDENDVASVQLGQRAEVEVDAMPGSVLEGVVTEISSSANSTGTGTAEQKTEFEVRIAITSPPPGLRPGMTATADVITRTEEKALAVPIQAVAARAVDQLAMKGEKREDAEKRYKPDRDGFVEIVFCVEAGKAVAKQVKTGIQSHEWIQILEGLKEGDEIVTGSYRAISKDLENGAIVTVTKEPRKGRGPKAG